MREQHDGLLPVQQASGPLQQVVPHHQDEEHHHLALFEALALAIYEVEELDLTALEDKLKNIITGTAVSWTSTKLTLHHLAASFTMEAMMDIPATRDQIMHVIDNLLDVNSWLFLQEVAFEIADGTHLHALDLYEQWCDDLASQQETWRNAPAPRPTWQFKETHRAARLFRQTPPR